VLAAPRDGADGERPRGHDGLLIGPEPVVLLDIPDELVSKEVTSAETDVPAAQPNTLALRISSADSDNVTFRVDREPV